MIDQDNSHDFHLASLEESARIIYESVAPTPQIEWPLLSRHCGADCEIWVKHENHLPTGAFKVRGGLLYFEWLQRTQPDCPGVIAATRGNHGQSVAFAAKTHGIPATLVIPHGNSPSKNNAMRAYGATLIEHGRDFNEALDHCEKLAAERGLHFVPSFDWRLVQGVASYGLELFRGVADLDAVYVPIGLGSGICGLAAARRALQLEARTQIIGVCAENAPAYLLSLEAGNVVPGPGIPHTIADGIAVRIPNEQAFAEILAEVTRIVPVSETAIRDAMHAYFIGAHQIAEGAGAAPLAAVIKEAENQRLPGKRIAVILTGGNVDVDLYAEILRNR